MTVANYEDGSYRIRKGWVNTVELDETYELSRLPKQPGQGYARWFNPIGESSVYDDFGETSLALGGSAKQVGGASFTWTLAGLTPGMVYYLKNDSAFFGGGGAEQFTVQTWDRQGYWRTVWVWGYFNPPSSAATPGYRRGYAQFTIPFLVVQDAPNAPDLTPTVSRDPDAGSDPAAQLSNIAFTLGAENVGDGATFADIVIVLDVPASFSYVTATPGDWSLEYFESGAWETTVTIAANVTRVRGTIGTALAAGASTPTFEVTLQTGIASGDVDVEVSVSTSGDSGAGNDDIIETVNVAV